MKGEKKELPNILVIMSDEFSACFSGTYGHPFIETPAMDRLAREGLTFSSAYCNSPLCVPSRTCFMTGRHVHNNGGWDNAVPIGDDVVTWPHLLRERGYETALCGKMHMVGRDHLHGFDRQISRDIHADIAHPIYYWRDGLPKAAKPWIGVIETGTGIPGHEGGSKDSPEDLAERRSIATGPGRTLEIDIDDMTANAAVDFILDSGRKQKPFALCVGFIAPHFPFVVPESYFNRYWPKHADLPFMPPGHLDSLPPAGKRLRDAFGYSGYTQEQIKKARCAYYGLVSYLDEKIGRILDALETAGLAGDTLVINTSDHGEMLGEHGLWRKMSFYDQAARIPLQVRFPGLVAENKVVSQCVSLVDVTATILDAAGVDSIRQGSLGIDGDSFYDCCRAEPGASWEDWKDEAFAEHNAHGTVYPQAMLRRGCWKLCLTASDPLEYELYNLETDPGEFENLADEARFEPIRKEMTERILSQWDHHKIRQRVIASQESRRVIRSIDPDAGLF